MCNVIRRNAAALLLLPVPFRTPWPLPAAAALPLRCRSAACEGSAASSREPVRQQPTGVMERGQRRGPLSECVPGLHGGRAAGDDRAETPWLLLRGGRAWVGCRGSQRQRRGCRKSEGVAAPGALAGAAALCIVLYLGAVLQIYFSSKCPFFQPSPRAALRLREHLPDGAAAGGLLLLSGSAARAFAAAARGTGAAPTGWRSSSQLPPPHRVSGGGAGGGRSLLPCAWAGVTKREGEPARLSLLLLSKADRVTVGQVWGCPPPPLGKVLYIGHMQHRGETTQGLCPCTPFHSRA